MSDSIPKYSQKPTHLQEAKSSFNKLSDKSFAKLEEITEHASLSQEEVAYINEQLLPFMYDNGLFTGSDYWIEGLEWVEQDTSRIKYLDLDNTLILLTSALAKDDNKGADYWYHNGITAQLLKHLLRLKD